LTNVAKTAAISLFAGLITYVVYTNINEYILRVGEQFAQNTFATDKLSTLNFIGGSMVLFTCACVFLPIYLLAANFWDVIDEDERKSVRNFARRIFPKRGIEPLAGTRS
jgi:hypothetical protein